MKNGISPDNDMQANKPASGTARYGATKIIVLGAILITLFIKGDQLLALGPAFAIWVESIGIWGPFAFAAGYA
ncbi:uncharacterized protein METZ01_LOCUS249422, partial [marine metagenome]